MAKKKKRALSPALAEYNGLRSRAAALGLEIPSGTKLDQLRELVKCAEADGCTPSVSQSRRTTTSTIRRRPQATQTGQYLLGYAHLPVTGPSRRR